MTFAQIAPELVARARDALSLLCPADVPMAWLYQQHAWIGSDDPDAPALLLRLRPGRCPPPKVRPNLWAKVRPVLLPARAGPSHGGRWRLPLVPSAHASLATGLSAEAVAAIADAFGPAFGGAETIEILA